MAPPCRTNISQEFLKESKFMASGKLVTAMGSVDWNDNVKKFLDLDNAVEGISQANLRLALWAREFESIEHKNPALCFVREMQISGHLVAVSTGLAIYKSAASAMRAMLETALYYTYFRTHEVELATLLSNPKYYISKTEVLEFHSLHTPDFTRIQGKLDLVGQLTPWYSSISAIIHGQIPGKWNQQRSISGLVPNLELQSTVIAEFQKGENLVNRLFLCTAGRELWDYVNPAAKKVFLRGLSGEVKDELGLDAA